MRCLAELLTFVNGIELPEGLPLDVQQHLRELSEGLHATYSEACNLHNNVIRALAIAAGQQTAERRTPNPLYGVRGAIEAVRDAQREAGQQVPALEEALDSLRVADHALSGQGFDPWDKPRKGSE